MKQNDTMRLCGHPVYERPILSVCNIDPEQGFTVSGSLENVTEEETETPW